MRRGILSRLLACVLASACVLSLQPFSVNAQSAADSQQTVKVGVLNNTTYAYQDQDGVWRGIDVECMATKKVLTSAGTSSRMCWRVLSWMRGNSWMIT